MGNSVFLSFMSTYFCDMSFSGTEDIKTKNYNKLNVESELHIATLEGIKLRFEKMKRIPSHHSS